LQPPGHRRILAGTAVPGECVRCWEDKDLNAKARCGGWEWVPGECGNEVSRRPSAAFMDRRGRRACARA